MLHILEIKLKHHVTTLAQVPYLNASDYNIYYFTIPFIKFHVRQSAFLYSVLGDSYLCPQYILRRVNETIHRVMYIHVFIYVQ